MLPWQAAKGTLLLNASGRVLTFIPDKDTSRKIITVSDKSQDSLTDSSGKQYKIHSAVKAYYNRGGKDLRRRAAQYPRWGICHTVL